MATLTASQLSQYERDGYLCPLPALDQAEASRFRGLFDRFLDQRAEQLAATAARNKYQFTSQMHYVYKWVWDLITHPRVLDPIEDLLGPNILVWDSNWFIKLPGDKTFVSWHQDGTYWNLDSAAVTTAWIALSPVNPENGCMRVIPGTHQQPQMAQRETDSQDNALSRGQEIVDGLDESAAVDLVLNQGEMSLHHLWIVHGSEAIRSNEPRIGIAVRYINTKVKYVGPGKPMVMLVRGRDDYGHFDLQDPPSEDCPAGAEDAHQEIIDRVRNSIMAEK